MKYLKNIAVIALLSLSSIAFAQHRANPAGIWQLKDKKGSVKMIIRIMPDNQQRLSAKILQYYPNKNARCDKCEGDLKDKPYRGLTFIRNLSAEKKNVWTGGKILNPETGKESKVTLKMSDTGQTITINSYRFLSWFGDKDEWIRGK